MTDLTQAEADALLELEKHRVDDAKWNYPISGVISIPLISIDKHESFFLDIRRSQFNLAKGTYQNRGRVTATLARLDFGGPPHRNPDGEEIESPHLHIYKEGFGDKWAYPVSADQFSNIDDPWVALSDFMKFCNIVNPPVIQQGLFT